MSNHTPGPWVAEPVQGGISITGHMGAHVARIGYRDNAAHADARLIAAAPELLEALRKADALLKNASMGRERTTLPAGNSLLDLLAGYMHPDEINGACDAVIAAFAKATGEPVA